jgi:Na+-translocating ferredoxin:NAD+ oxidoreductase RnfC subunit
MELITCGFESHLNICAFSIPYVQTNLRILNAFQSINLCLALMKTIELQSCHYVCDSNFSNNNYLAHERKDEKYLI